MIFSFNLSMTSWGVRKQIEIKNLTLHPIKTYQTHEMAGNHSGMKKPKLISCPKKGNFTFPNIKTANIPRIVATKFITSSPLVFVKTARRKTPKIEP